MHIASVKIAQLPNGISPDTRNANLFFHSGDTRIHLHVTVPAPEDPQSSDIVADLIRDGLRQLRRMPGYRRGERDVQITPETTIICEGCS